MVKKNKEKHSPTDQTCAFAHAFTHIYTYIHITYIINTYVLCATHARTHALTHARTHARTNEQYDTRVIHAYVRADQQFRTQASSLFKRHRACPRIVLAYVRCVASFVRCILIACVSFCQCVSMSYYCMRFLDLHSFRLETIRGRERTRRTCERQKEWNYRLKGTYLFVFASFFLSRQRVVNASVIGNNEFDCTFTNGRGRQSRQSPVLSFVLFFSTPAVSRFYVHYRNEGRKKKWKRPIHHFEHPPLCFCFAVCQLVCWLLCCSQCTAKWTVHRLWQPIPTTRASPRVSPLPPKEIPA